MPDIFNHTAACDGIQNSDMPARGLASRVQENPAKFELRLAAEDGNKRICFLTLGFGELSHC